MPSSLSSAFAHAVETTSPRFLPTSSNVGATTQHAATEPAQSAIREPEPGRFHLVVSDPIATYYLVQDPCVKVVKAQQQLEGYEIYLVEQWACSRSHPSFTIATYTGHPSHKILVGILSIDKDESRWGRELANYFRFVRYYGREKQTPLGSLMVTNLSNLSSDLTVIAVSDGNVLEHKEDFIINEDLKRMGCSGRIALTLTAPTDAAKAKFHQLFRTCERVEFRFSVIELVRLCQLALIMFQKLDKHFGDGLLCDETERAIRKWWAEYGTDFYNAEPSDGILGPTTVAALLGMMIGARNRLSLCGAPVPKDAFDIPGLKGAIGYFQKQHKLRRTRRLDRETVDKLHRITIKGSSGDKYGMVPKAIKSTVAEMSGKTHKVEMETCDLEKFIMHLSGERAKHLWRGKPMKSLQTQSSAMPFGDSGPRRNSAPIPSVNGAPVRTTKNLTPLVIGPYDLKNDPNVASPEENPTSYPLSAPAYPTAQFGFHGHAQPPHSDSRDPLRKAMFKTMNNRMNDAKTGLGKIKDVATGVASGISGQVTKRASRKHAQDNMSCTNDVVQATDEQKCALGNAGAASSSSPVLDLGKKPSLTLVQHGDQEAAKSDSTTIHVPQKKPAGDSATYDAYHTESPIAMSIKSPFHNDSIITSKFDIHRTTELISPMTPGSDTETPFEKTLERKPDGTVMVEFVPQTGGTGTTGTRNGDPSVSGSVQAYQDALERLANQSPEFKSALGGLMGAKGELGNGGLWGRSRSFSERWEGKRHGDWFPRRMSFGCAEEAILGWEGIGEEDYLEIEPDGSTVIAYGGCPKQLRGMMVKAEEEDTRVRGALPPEFG
ncbi:hypothetical protein L211DRAFT_295573 [Terfezia boudieri ATCC MYA-4762]|uniref:STB6-like N-terminal domain-containing protein n=1 Tax=Terfezia boudieri ATCC MYA-4762 TaxID=1051890 RepID=A0A3N4LP51_9PEZI|nr:hypothetical protein L211DRAFT_295573 [Terfezia boudieri ATCC MYA-4762]